jgi:hypothetical protein
MKIILFDVLDTNAWIPVSFVLFLIQDPGVRVHQREIIFIKKEE